MKKIGKAEPQELLLTVAAVQNLQKTGKWSRFLGITGLISSGILFLFGIFFASIIKMIYQHPTTYYRLLDLYGANGYRFKRPPFVYSSFMAILYASIAIFVFFISLNLYQFGTEVKLAIVNNSASQISSVFNRLRRFFKSTGIIVMCVIVASIIIAVYLTIIIYTIRTSPDFHKPGLK